MPRVLITREDGEVFWNETVKAADFETEHFRLGLADRLGWAVADAEGPTHTSVRPTRPAPRMGGGIANVLPSSHVIAA
jgi:hypothetical protein